MMVSDINYISFFPLALRVRMQPLGKKGMMTYGQAEVFPQRMKLTKGSSMG